ncbi:hypothetical protein RF55_6399 [Lasius niger]|uniref:Uncharacterized protein n=1 Tax=Lasius niger TaxID=67767 RepID=A0A0J7KT34_LASNI|nr:hypothetical protein RF55_6399 [Lasius niger]
MSISGKLPVFKDKVISMTVIVNIGQPEGIVSVRSVYFESRQIPMQDVRDAGESSRDKAAPSSRREMCPAKNGEFYSRFRTARSADHQLLTTTLPSEYILRRGETAKKPVKRIRPISAESAFAPGTVV